MGLRPHSVHVRVPVSTVGPCPRPLLRPGFTDLASVSTGPRDSHHQQLPALCVPSSGSGKSPNHSLDPCLPWRPSPLPAMAASGPRKASFSESRSSHQAATGSQILPGDEIIQINEQVVVSGGEGAGRPEVMGTEEGCWRTWGSHPRVLSRVKTRAVGATLA